MRVKVINKRPASVLQKKRVCAYARVSTDSRRQEDSLENQMETYERLITGNPEYEFIGVFADQGISGYCENRPQFQRMMEKARAGEIDLIITKSISRFARNTVTVLKFARELKELGVGIFFEEQNINTLSGDGEMMLAVLASFAQEESRSMSENNKWSIRKKFERGEVMITTSRFLGYDKNEYGDLIVNRKEAEIVSLTFDLYCIYENGKLKQSSEDIYRTESWEYTEDGHLMFSGRLAFEGSYEVTRNEIMEYMAYRVLSLDETCRELNRKYILPIGYERNNMFLTDWSEEEFAELDFYDMFDLFYQENHTANGEFTFGNAMGTSAVYLISKEKFEPVIKSKFKISSEVLQSKTVYYPCEEVYEYKPRGLEETEYPEYPYPEVIGYVNNDDGTLTLKVQAVFPYRGVSKAYIHEVTVRDTKDGGIQYVGNRIIEPINNPEIRWHVPRLTRTEWEELYGDN